MGVRVKTLGEPEGWGPGVKCRPGFGGGCEPCQGSDGMRAEDSLWTRQGRVTEETLSEGSFVEAGGVGHLSRTPHGPHLAPGASRLDAKFF